MLIDDLGYVQQSREEMEVLFTFLAERYERRSVMVTSNLVFSEWRRIFKDPMTTAAAIDRIVHHSVILELTGPTWRGDEAMQRVEEAARAAEPEQPQGVTTEPPPEEVTRSAGTVPTPSPDQHDEEVATPRRRPPPRNPQKTRSRSTARRRPTPSAGVVPIIQGRLSRRGAAKVKTRSGR